MKNDKIVAAYDKAAPEPGTEDRIWAGVARAAERTEERKAKRHPVLRRALLAAACVALLASLVVGGYAAYERWKLPEPEPYTLDPEQGNVSVHTEQSYPFSQTESSAAESAEPEKLSDAWFIQRGREILANAGITELSDGAVTVRRQKHLYWNREEVDVSYPDGEDGIEVVFDAERGVFLGMTGIRWVLSDTAACRTQAEADALARRYYESLPVEQGYVMTGCEKYDEQFWSYDFCREVEPGLYSWYECVRVAINPVSGTLEDCVVFYVPLLDDHQPGDVPLTEEEALEALRAQGFDLGSGEGVSIRKVVALPNWMFTDHAGVDLQAPDVSRLCWKLSIEKKYDEFTTSTYFLVDYYTGELLGGDTTG
ncbi:MAG: hypothetical protein IKQ54_10580 [Oscillospiraceae bacterium]|nr:hypothetical protein [Oscillospiraceae bacterium]